MAEEAREARQNRIISAALQFAAGDSDIKQLAPEWDRAFMSILKDGDLREADGWSPTEMTDATSVESERRQSSLVEV